MLHSITTLIGGLNQLIDVMRKVNLINGILIPLLKKIIRDYSLNRIYEWTRLLARILFGSESKIFLNHHVIYASLFYTQ